MRSSSIVPVVVAVATGSAIGWLDVHASAVQGTLLLLMFAAFAIALSSRAPAWLIAIAVAVGLPLGAAVSSAVGRGGDPQFAMLIATIPLAVAAYAGRGASALIQSAAETLAPDTATTLGKALVVGTVLGVAPVFGFLSAADTLNAWWVTLIWQIVTFVAWTVATPILLRARGASSPALSRHVQTILAIALAHAVVLPLLTRALFIPLPAIGVGAVVLWGISVYLPLDALTYCLVIWLAHASDTGRQAREAFARESAVRGELASSRLAALRAQLRPHFLFNALNAASVLTRRGDSERSSNVLTQLAELLRYVLRAEQELVPLHEELAFAEAYLAIERERFPDRLKTSFDVDADIRDARIPHLLLQPLVENAIQHGIGAKLAAGLVAIRVHRDGDVLDISVEDDGPGPGVPPDSSSHAGIGLGNTAARLLVTYGDSASLMLTERPNGGCIARVRLPYRP